MSTRFSAFFARVTTGRAAPPVSSSSHKALCLSARAVLCGRAYAYGLAAAGEAGVSRALEILRADLERMLRRLGCASVADLDRSFISCHRP